MSTRRSSRLTATTEENTFNDAVDEDVDDKAPEPVQEVVDTIVISPDAAEDIQPTVFDTDQLAAAFFESGRSKGQEEGIMAGVAATALVFGLGFVVFKIGQAVYNQN